MADADWSRLPDLAVTKISESLDFPTDYISFRSVCTTWRSASLRRTYSPLLLLQRLDGSPLLRTVFRFASIDTNRATFSHLPRSQMNFGSLPCCGCSNGWIALLDRTPRILLINPISGASIPLPAFTSFPDCAGFSFTKTDGGDFGAKKIVSKSTFKYHRSDGENCKTRLNFDEMQQFIVNKVILSADPSEKQDFIAVAIRCMWQRIEFCRPGDDEWIPVDYSPKLGYRNADPLFYKGRFYVASKHRIYALDLGTDSDQAVEIPFANPPWDVKPSLCKIGESYLVESDGDILLVLIINRPFSDSMILPELYKLEWEGDKVMLKKMKSLGGRALFIGRNQTFSISTSNYPELEGDKIYMAEDFWFRNRIFVTVMHVPGNCASSNGCLNTTSKDYWSRSSVVGLDWEPCAWFKPSLLR